MFTSMTSSIGNLFTTGDILRLLKLFNSLYYFSFLLYGSISLVIWNVINTFITVWLGPSFILSDLVVLVLVYNFYTSGMQSIVSIFRESTGIFNKNKYRPIFAAIINLITSLILALLIGLPGIFIGTLISRFSVYFWMEPKLLNKHVFESKLRYYFKRYFLYFSIFSFSIIVSFLLNTYLPSFNFLLKTITITSVSVLLFVISALVLTHKSEDFIGLKNFLDQIKNNIVKTR